ASSGGTRRGVPPTLRVEVVRGGWGGGVVKCEKRPRTRRYETANGLAMDVQRYLHDEPVLACPPSTGYRLRKFARKYRTLLRIAGAFVVLLVLAAGVSAWQAVRATLAGRQASEAGRQALAGRGRARGRLRVG